MAIKHSHPFAVWDADFDPLPQGKEGVFWLKRQSAKSPYNIGLICIHSSGIFTPRFYRHLRTKIRKSFLTAFLTLDLSFWMKPVRSKKSNRERSQSLRRKLFEIFNFWEGGRVTKWNTVNNKGLISEIKLINSILDGLLGTWFSSPNTLPLPCGMLISTRRISKWWGCLIAMRFYNCE